MGRPSSSHRCFRNNTNPVDSLGVGTIPLEYVPRARATQQTDGIAKLEDFIDLIHVYPSMAEALKIAAISYFKDPAKLSCCAE